MTDTELERRNLRFGWALFGLFWLLFVHNVFKAEAFRHNHFLDRCRRDWWFIICFLTFLGMWALLALLTVYRHTIITSAGESRDGDDRWTFGQVLALATWMPVLVEFFVIFVCELRAACTARIPGGIVCIARRADQTQLLASHGPPP